ISTLHDLTLAGQYADRVLMLDGGEMVAEGPPAEVLTPERLAAHYGAEVQVLTVGGRQVVVPVRPAP
ncbi:MAG: ABC transporter ATP-binding protein, partial [Thermocrispum sp.]